MKHELKCWPEYFREMLYDRRKFEVRKNDRNFKCGDTLHLREWDPQIETYTGVELGVKVDYILQGGQFGIEPGYCVMSIAGWYRDYNPSV